ncbi:hypothetical protein ABIA25_000743 [Sinorhizobium fredii]|uniref:hypothetical protein n=1 Tax=Rhizobium fredii TaxID=380 RepID=UPI00351729C2
MCISCVQYARFLTEWKTYIVQRSYARGACYALGTRKDTAATTAGQALKIEPVIDAATWSWTTP